MVFNNITKEGIIPGICWHSYSSRWMAQICSSRTWFVICYICIRFYSWNISKINCYVKPSVFKLWHATVWQCDNLNMNGCTYSLHRIHSACVSWIKLIILKLTKNKLIWTYSVRKQNQDANVCCHYMRDQ